MVLLAFVIRDRTSGADGHGPDSGHAFVLLCKTPMAEAAGDSGTAMIPPFAAIP
jgi:hypothetical protein